MSLHYYSDLATQTTLTNSISNSATQITVASTTGFPASFPYYLALDFSINGNTNLEVVEVTAAASLLLTVNRGVSGTSAVAHSNGAAVVHVAPAQFYNDTSVHTNSNSGVHGVVGNVVGTSDTQTLTNKSIDGTTNTLTNLPAGNLNGVIAIANGGTNASTAATARTNLGLAIGTNVEAWSAGLDAMSTELAAANSGLLVQNGTNTVTFRSIAVGASGSGSSNYALAVTNPTGSGGNPTVALKFTTPAPQVYTANGTFTSANAGGAPYLRIIGVNGGPGGGGAAAAASGASSGGGGASGASGAVRTIATASLTYPLQVNVGAGGAGGVGNASGGAGSQSSVIDNNGAGSTLWTPGVPTGNASGGGSASGTTVQVCGVGGFSQAAASPTADAQFVGGSSSHGIRYAATFALGGNGGSSFLGGGGVASASPSANGQAGQGYGGGGAGGASAPSGTAANGGAGGGGLVIIEPIY